MNTPSPALERVRAVLAPIWDTATPGFHYAQAVLDALGIPADADLLPFHKIAQVLALVPLVRELLDASDAFCESEGEDMDAQVRYEHALVALREHQEAQS